MTKRRKAFEAQLPDALSLVASSLSAGHTFLRAVQMMCEESAPPMSEEFARLVAETRLGDNVTDALERMAARLQIRDLDMVVQAIRIQQTVGGRLADLLPHPLRRHPGSGRGEAGGHDPDRRGPDVGLRPGRAGARACS